MRSFHLLDVVLLAMAVGLFCQKATATVVLRTGNYSFDALPDMPADFGPPVPAEGLSGVLLVADPEDGCSPLRRPVERPWIALLARSRGKSDECTFDIKVRHAEDAGAIAAIVYDDVFEGLVIMAKPLDHPDPGIPAVFVTQRSGLAMRKLVASGGATTVLITPMSDIVWLSMILSALAGCFAISVVLAAFYMVRRPQHGEDGLRGPLVAQLHRPRGMTKEQLRALPVVVHTSRDNNTDNNTEESADHTSFPSVASEDEEEGNGSALECGSGGGGGGLTTRNSTNTTTRKSTPGRTAGDTAFMCAICLETYSSGDKLRVLPCSHRYHRDCIDQWLSTRKPLCPVCKWDATQRDVESGQVEGGSGGGEGGGSNVNSGGGLSGAAEQASAGVRNLVMGLVNAWGARREESQGAQGVVAGASASSSSSPSARQDAERRELLPSSSSTPSDNRDVPLRDGGSSSGRQQSDGVQDATLSNFPHLSVGISAPSSLPSSSPPQGGMGSLSEIAPLEEIDEEEEIEDVHRSYGHPLPAFYAK